MKNLFIISLFFLLPGCKKEKLPGTASIESFSVTDISHTGLTIDQVFIDEPGKTIFLLFTNDLPVDSFPLSLSATYTITSGATALPASGEVLSFSNPDDWKTYTLTAENGDQIEYLVVLRDNQIPNSGFEDWYDATGAGGVLYKEPGTSALNRVWATANDGTSIYQLYGTIPVVDGDNTAAQISTGGSSAIPIMAGTLFTGKFDTDAAFNNPTDPRKAAIFGIPFTHRPNALKFRYTYQPGSTYIKGTLNNPNSIIGGFTVTPLEGEDKFSAFAFLEVRNGEEITEVGRAEISLGDTQLEFTELTLPFIYRPNQPIYR
jgi:hypothetical protein